MKRFLPTILIMLVLLAVPTAVFAHTQALSTTTFYACENAQGKIDPNSITQNDSLLQSGSCVGSDVVAKWSVTGPKGDSGPIGSQGPKGDTGVAGPQGPIGLTGPQGNVGPAGIPFTQSACAETGLSGPASQENKAFCKSGIEPDGGLVYKAAINAAKVRVLVGTPISAFPDVDWSNVPVTYVEFTSGFHAEYHVDNVVRIYNTLNQRVS